MNGLQFLALLIACATIYLYSIHDKLKDNTMTEWPENKNPILTIFRENFDTGDKWGSTIIFLFALCDVATDLDVEIPSELEFSPSPFGSDTEEYNYKAIMALITEGEYIYSALTIDELREHVAHALKVLGKYDSILRLEGENY